MAGIQLGGVNLDVKGIVSQLMQLESRPLVKLQEQQTQYNLQLSELGRLKSALSTFQSSMENLSSLEKFETYKTSNSEDSDSQTYTASVDENAESGTYSIEVTSLAEAHKIGTSTAVGAADTYSPATPTDKLELSVGSDSISVDIDGKTITQVRDEINSQAQDNEVGVSASVIQTGTDEFQLVITATETGTENAIVVTSNTASTGVGSLDLNLSQNIQDAADGKVEIDGYEVVSSTNTIEDAIEGVSLNLLDDLDSVSTLTVSRDTAAVTSSINDFIESYNTLMSSIEIYESGALEGDSFLDSVKSAIRNQLNTSSETGTFNYLAEIGVTSNADTGDLELNSTVLEKAISADYEAVSKLFADEDNGIAYRLDNIVDDFISYSGLIKSKEDGINDRLRYNADSQDTMSYRLEAKETAFLKQFSALDSLIGQMSSTSNALAGQLSNLPGFTRN